MGTCGHDEQGRACHQTFLMELLHEQGSTGESFLSLLALTSLCHFIPSFLSLPDLQYLQLRG